MARAMRKRIFLPLFTILIFFPFLIFVLSYTRFFNDEVRDILVSIVDGQTNARLYIGKIHGSILGSFRIDGAALMCEGKPIAMVDTIEISHLPLSIITKTVEVLQCRLVNPRFYLVQYRDGTTNVDHIGKGPSKPGGKSDWFIILKSLKIQGGEFSLYDSTKVSSLASADSSHRFNSANFRLENIELSASGNISGNNLTASIKNISLDVDPVGVRINSLKFDFFTSKVGAEVSGLDLVSEAARLKGDFTLTGQNLLDSIELRSLRQKQITASFDANNIDLNQVKKFLELPIDPVSKVNVNCFASGNLDTLYVKQLSVKTDSSFVPLSATLYRLTDPKMSMRVETHGSSVSASELSAMLKSAGVPDLGKFKRFLLDAEVEGMPSDLKVNGRFKSGETDVSGDARVQEGSYAGELHFHNLHLEDFLNTQSMSTTLTGGANFSLNSSSGSFPKGTIVLQIDSSTIQRASLRDGRINITSLSDSMEVDLRLLTSRGNVSGNVIFNTRMKSYSSDLSFSELDLASFVGSQSLSGISTGKLSLSGNGFDLDSLDGKILVFFDNSTLGGVPINNSAFVVTADTRSVNKYLRLSSPFVDASVSGNFVAARLPSQLSNLVAVLADSFSSKLTGKHGSQPGGSIDISGVNASLTANVKDARFIGKLIGMPDLRGNPEARLNILSTGRNIALNGSVDADSIGYSMDSLKLSGSQLHAQFNLNTDNEGSVWTSGMWTIGATFRSLDINQTHLSAKILRVGYSSSNTSGNDSLSVTALCQVDTLAEFYIDASGEVRQDSFYLSANTLLGKLYGVSLSSSDIVHIGYSPGVFTIAPANFFAGFDGSSSKTDSKILVKGQYSLEKGPNLQFAFNNIGLASLQRIFRVDTSSLKVNGKVNGDASLAGSPSGVDVSIDFLGKDVDYNGAKSKVVDGTIKIHGNYLELSSQLSKPADSSGYALRIEGTIPLSDSSSKAMQLRIGTDSLNISFLAPFLQGIGELKGNVSGSMIVSGTYSLPEFNGSLNVSDGKIVRLAANQITYPFTGTIDGQGDKLVLNPVLIENRVGQTNTAMMARGSLEIRNNTIAAFDIDLDGTLLALNSISRQGNQEVFGTAIVGSGEAGLKLKGSLASPFLEGSGIIQSTTLTLMPLQNRQTNQVEDVIYRFPVDTANEKTSNVSKMVGAAETAEETSSGSFVDSLRYNLSVDTKDNVNLRMIFNPTTNEELDAVLGGRLHLSNLSGSMELTGDVNIQTGSTYNFYGKQFSATGKIRFSGDPLNPVLDITGIYQGQRDTSTSTSSTGKTQIVVVQLRITGTFNQPSINISMTVDNVPYTTDPQTNAISFILTGQFADELTASQKQSAAKNLWSQYGAGALSSVVSSGVSGYVTKLLGDQFNFIQSVDVLYNPNLSKTEPGVQITTKVWDGTLKVQTPIVTDISSTGFSFMYPIWGSLIASASRNVIINKGLQGPHEATDMLRLFYQISF
jgi:hypothetical protein